MTLPLSAADKKDGQKSAEHAVDSGSFDVFVKGQHVITESFSVQQENGVSLVKSHLRETASPSAAGQTSELQMTGSGELVRYQWSDANGSLEVTPNNEFLIEKIKTSASSKPAEQPFLMPNTSAILDNNFFIHREVLAWRFLAGDCHNESGALKCKPGDDFGVLVPQDRTSMRVRLELVGREKVNIHGTDRDLLRLNLKGESFAWALWVDDKDQFKLMRVLIPDDNTEVVRE
ncbi:MAG TPA: hypothetical protein VND65_01695 [Candidatus Binatia bacterium]|nr:hypothetical protein [Candidatus Binatia bacterium]